MSSSSQSAKNPAEHSVPPQALLGVLANQATRTAFARAVLGDLDLMARGKLNSRDRKAVDRLIRLGFLLESEDGALAVDGDALRATLANSAVDGQHGPRSGLARFLGRDGLGPRIDAMPAKPRERTELLHWVRDSALAPEEVLSEAQLNQRLRVFHDDVAMLRRYLVDEGLLERTPSGAEYRIP